MIKLINLTKNPQGYFPTELLLVIKPVNKMGNTFSKFTPYLLCSGS